MLPKVTCINLTVDATIKNLKQSINSFMQTHNQFTQL